MGAVAAVHESAHGITGGPFRLGVRLQLEVLRTYPVQSLIQFPLDLGCLANVLPRTVGVHFLSQRWIVTLINHQARAIAAAFLACFFASFATTVSSMLLTTSGFPLPKRLK